MCVRSRGAFPRARFSGLVTTGDLGNEKCASLNDVSLTRLFRLQKTKKTDSFFSLTKTGFSYNMRDPIWEKEIK